MASLVLTFFGMVFAVDAVMIACLSSDRVSGDRSAMRTGAAFAGVFLAAGAVCLIAAWIAA